MNIFLLLSAALGVDAIGTAPKNVACQGSPVSFLREVPSPDLLEAWREYEQLRTSELDASVLAPFFRSRPKLVAGRLVKASTTLARARRHWVKHEDGEHLCQAVSSLGPVAVKIGQTLSERPDLVGNKAANALKTLQTKNVPFDNDLAMAILYEELWDHNDTSISFESFSEEPAACASLGQVYKATLHDGREVAVKIQRPDAMAILALDAQCFRLVFGTRKLVQKLKIRKRKGSKDDGDYNDDENDDVGKSQSPAQASMETERNKQDIGAIIDRVARDIFDEIDYTIEAKNNEAFRQSLSFLGFVTTPPVVLVTERVIITEWVQGRHLDELTTEEGLEMTRMAIEACTASMTLTGFVHADPHEGNLMLQDDGKLVFMDFGLMSCVDNDLMEAFARGILALLSEDWMALAEAFVDAGFVTTPLMHRNGRDDEWKIDPNFGMKELSVELKEAIETTEGGKERFGALLPAVNQKLSPRWLVSIPPSVLLLIRTYLTLEGIAGKVDPQFNIYEMAMQWAIRRSLSPSTEKGITTLRSTLLKDDRCIQWERLLSLTEQLSSSPVKMDSDKSSAVGDTLGRLLGSADGKVLRQALRDVDSSDLIQKLNTKQGKVLLRKAADVSVAKVISRTKLGRRSGGPVKPARHRPVSEESIRISSKAQRWKKMVTKKLIMLHIRRQFLSLKRIARLMLLAMCYLRMVAVSLSRKVFLSAANTSRLWKKPSQDEKITSASPLL